MEKLVSVNTALSDQLGKLTETLAAQTAATATRNTGGRKRATTSHIDRLSAKFRSRPAAAAPVWDRYSRTGTKEYAELEEALSHFMRRATPDGRVVFPEGSDDGPYHLWSYSPDKAPDLVKTTILEAVMDRLGSGSPVQVWTRVVARCVLGCRGGTSSSPPQLPSWQDRCVAQARGDQGDDEAGGNTCHHASDPVARGGGFFGDATVPPRVVAVLELLQPGVIAPPEWFFGLAEDRGRRGPQRLHRRGPH
jgi:hypothetical protein